jgi:signal transduction histidine kinase
MGPVGGFQDVGVRFRRHPRTTMLTASGWLLGAAVTGLILGTPYLVFGYHSPSLHVVLDSVDGCVALLVAYLLLGRFTRSRLLQDLLLAQGLLLFGIAGLAPTVFQGLVDDGPPETLDAWLPMTVRVVAATLVAAAAFAGRRAARRGWTRAGWALPLLVVATALVVLWLSRDSLPPAIGTDPPLSAQRPVITGHPVLLLAQGLCAVEFFVASVAFTLQARDRRDELLITLGPALALGAFARVNYVIFPSLYSNWLYTGDLLRTGCYLVLLVGAAREISQYWSAQARAAVLDDRRRLARELHDGVIQELGYIRAEAMSVGRDEDASRRITASCDRALDEARAAVDALGRTPDQPLSVVLHQAALQVAERYGGSLELDLDDSVTADVHQRHALVRIIREAVSNALRHGQAARVWVRLACDHGGRGRLVVRDNGRGFDVDQTRARSRGYGLTSMRERALGLPGSFAITSAPEQGTEVEVSW